MHDVSCSSVEKKNQIHSSWSSEKSVGHGLLALLPPVWCLTITMRGDGTKWRAMSGHGQGLARQTENSTYSAFDGDGNGLPEPERKNRFLSTYIMLLMRTSTKGFIYTRMNSKVCFTKHIQPHRAAWGQQGTHPCVQLTWRNTGKHIEYDRLQSKQTWAY